MNELELENNTVPVDKMELEEEKFPMLKVTSEISQKHAVHMFCKKFSNFSIEESIIFNWKQPTGQMKSLIYSTERKRYFEYFANLLVHSKNTLRLYNIQKFYEDFTGNINDKNVDLLSNENYELHLINEFNFVGIIQRVLLYEKFDQTFMVVGLSEAKISTLIFDQENNSLRTVSMYSFENLEINKIREGRTIYQRPNILRKDPFYRCIGYLIYETVLVLLVSKELFPYLNFEIQNSAYTINVSLDDTWKEKDLFGPSIYFELKQSGIYSPVDCEFLWNMQTVSFCVLNERMSGDQGTTKELYLFKLHANDFKKREFKKSEKPLEATKIYERYQNYIKYVNLAPDCYKIASLMHGGLLVISPCLIYYCFSKTQYILSIKPFEYITTVYKSLIQKENLYVNPEIIDGAGLINANVEVINNWLLLLSTANDFFLLQLNFDENSNLKDMRLRKLNVFHGREIEFHSFSFYKINPQKDRFSGLFFANSKSEVSSLVYMSFNNIENISFQIKFLDEIINFPAFYDLNIIEDKHHRPEKFITCGGVNMKSALYMFKNELTPQIICDLPIDDEIDMIFTIKNDEKEIIYHNFIIISLKNGTSRVLYFEENFQLNEENSEFQFLSDSTLYCKRIRLGLENNNSKSCSFLLQATKHQMRLLDLSAKRFVNLYQTIENEIIQIVYLENTIFMLMKDFSLQAVNLGWKVQSIAQLNEANYLLSLECIDYVTVNFEQKFDFKDTDNQNLITTMSIMNLKMALNEQSKPQKYLVLCFLDGKLCFYNVFLTEIKRLKITRVFLCNNANEGLPYLINSQNSNVDCSITDPNYKLKIPISKRNNFRIIEEIAIYHLNKTLLLLMRIDDNEFFIYRGNISLDKQINNFFLVFTRIKLDVSFTVQISNTEIMSLQKSSLSMEREPSTNIKISNPIAKRRGICKHKYSKAIQTIFVSNCPHAFAIFERNGEIFAHTVHLPLENTLNLQEKQNFIQGFAKFTYPETVNNPNSKGCIFVINEQTLVFCKLAFADYDQVNIKEDYSCFDYRSPLPFISIIFHDKVIDKFEILEFNQKRFLVLSVYKKLMDRNGMNDQRKYELLLLDSENYSIKTKHEFNDNESIISVKRLNIADNSSFFYIGVAVGIYAEVDDQLIINSKLVILEIHDFLSFSTKNEIFVSDDLISDFFSLNSNIFLCIGNQISVYDWLSQKSYHTCSTEKNLLVSSSLIEKKMVNCGDIKKGFVCFLLEQYIENNKPRYKLIQRCQESLTAMSVLHNELFYFEGTLRVITSDPIFNNIGIYKLADDKKGFEKIGDFYTSYKINKLLKNTRDITRENLEIFYCSDEGYIGAIVPLSGNLDIKMIINVYSDICEKLPFVAGLNPKEFRNPKKSQNEYVSAKKNIIDLQLLSVFCFLTFPLQKKIASNLGTTREYILTIILHLTKLLS